MSSVALRGATIVLGLALVPVLLNTVGDEGYGLLMLAATILGYFGLLGVGVPAGVVKYIAEYAARGDENQIATVLDTALAFFIVVGILSAFGLVFFAEAGGLRLFNISESNYADAQRLIWVAAAFSLIHWPGSILISALEGVQEYHRKNVIVLIAHTLSLVSGIMAALFQADLVTIFIAQRTPLVLQWFLMHRAVKRYLPHWTPRLSGFDWPSLRQILSLSLWMFVLQAAVLLFYSTDELIIGSVLSVAVIAVYKITVYPFQLVAMLLAMFNTAVMPAVSAIEADGGAGERNRFAYLGARYSNLFVAPLAIGAAYFCGPFIRLWVGEPYLEYLWIAQIACLFQLLWQSNGFLGAVFFGSGKANRLAMLAIGSAIANVGLSIWWGITFGVPGVILATIVTGCIGVPLQYLWLFPQLGLSRRRYLKESIFAGQLPGWIVGIMLIPLWPHVQAINSWSALIIHVCAVTILFAGIMWFIGIQPHHRHWLLNRIRRQLSP